MSKRVFLTTAASLATTGLLTQAQARSTAFQRQPDFASDTSLGWAFATSSELRYGS